MEDMVKTGLLLGGVGLAAVGVLSVVFSFFVALGSAPSRRAAWTAGLAYLVVAVGGMFVDMGGMELAAPLVALPGALLTFLYWWWTFRRGWIENAEDAPEGTAVETDDWRVGLLYFVLLAFLALSYALVRLFMRGYWAH
jgi:hypothetical protein